jgi:putative acetyltransferase
MTGESLQADSLRQARFFFWDDGVTKSARPAMTRARTARRNPHAHHRAVREQVTSTMNIRPSLPSDADALLEIWLHSVRASHTFLTEADIQSLLPSVRHYFALPSLELWMLCTDSGVPVGFMGLSGCVVDALFLAPEHLRQGGGTLLLEHARRLKGTPLCVEVNEQNPAALQFYLARGFTVVGRSPVDTEGRPFPLLQLREVSQPRRQ